jgi:hypothetical protein
MASVKFYKSLNSLPGTLAADGIYFVKTGLGFSLYATDVSGVAVPLLANITNMGTWVLPSLDANLSTISSWQPQGNAVSNPSPLGFQNLTTLGSVTARTLATTNAGTRIRRLGFLGAITAGTLVGARISAGQVTLGASPIGGFIATTIFGCSDAATVSGARQFCGVTSNIAAPTNVEPSTLLNCIGAGHGAADTTLKIYTAGSAANAPIDLGVNFPVNTLNGIDQYKLTVYAPLDPIAAGFKAAWHVKRFGTTFSASGILTGAAGTTVPSTSTMLTLNNWRTNNVTALAPGLDLGAITLQQLD